MYNSDGYVMIDMGDVDLTRSSQNIPGIYNRVVEVIDTNKLALIINAGNNTPMAAIVHKRLNYYVINTTLFIFTINSNDIVIVEEAGTSTVDVEIVPTLMEGTKIADFAIGEIEGSLYAPTQQSEINDNVTASNTTWSSDKISTELSGKADCADLATVATTGDYTDLTNKPTIPVLTDLIDDTTTTTTSVWSSDKTAAEIAAGAGVTIDDTTTSTTKTWSSDKINTEISAKPSIDDTTSSSSAVYSSDKVDTLLSAKADISTTYTKTEVDTALSGKASTTDVTSLQNALGGYSLATHTPSSGDSITIDYTEACIVVIGRGAGGLYYGHWSGVNALVTAQNHTVTYSTVGGKNRLTITNSAGVTDRITIIYK